MSNSKNACADQSSCHNKLDQTRFVLTETASGEASAETHSQDNNDNCTTLVHGRADGCDIDGMDAQVSDEVSGGSNTVDVKDEANTVSLQQQQEFELPAFDNSGRSIHSRSLDSGPVNNSSATNKAVNRTDTSADRQQIQRSSCPYSADPNARTDNHAEQSDENTAMERMVVYTEGPITEPTSWLEQRVVRCHSCGFNNLNDNDDLPLEHHAKFNISCPNIQNDLDAEFIDLKSKKPEMFGENLEHLRLKEWLLCKACSLSHSAVILSPCQHFCLCQSCAETATGCPICSSTILQTITVQLVTEIP